MAPLAALLLPPAGALLVILLGRRSTATAAPPGRAAEPPASRDPLGKQPGAAPTRVAQSSKDLLSLLERARAAGASPAVLQVLDRKARKALLREGVPPGQAPR